MIVWICNRCAEKAGGRIPDGHIATWHWDICDACGKRKPCTHPRDFQLRPALRGMDQRAEVAA